MEKDMLKNIAIGALVVICCILSVKLFSGVGMQGLNLSGGKLSQLQIIESADVYGLTLDTPVEEIDTLVAQIPFECRVNEYERKIRQAVKTPEVKSKDESVSENTSEQVAEQESEKAPEQVAEQIVKEKVWHCSHKVNRGANLRIEVADGKIQKLMRNGLASEEEINATVAQYDILKSKMKSMEGFSMSLSERSSSFQIRYKKEDGKATSMSLRTNFMPVRDPKNSPERNGMLDISFVR